MDRAAPIEGSGELLLNMEAALVAPQVPPGVHYVAANISSILNAALGLIVTLVIVYFFLQLIRWMFFGSDSPRGKNAPEAATRAFLVLFLMIDVWFIIRLMQKVMDISPVFAYAIVLISFLLIGCWSLLGIGKMLLEGLSWIVDTIVLYGIRGLRRAANTTPLFQPLARLSDAALKLLILAIVLIPITILWGI